MRITGLLCAIALSATACIPDLEARDSAIEPPTPVPAATPGGTITIGVPPIPSVDPALVHEPVAALITRTACDQLVSFDPVTSELVPALASSWTVTQGGRGLFVNLRRGVRFTDGSELTAADVVASLSRLASQELASPSAGLMAPVTGFSFIRGTQQAPSVRHRTELIGVSAAASHTVEFTLDEPHADFVRVLGHPATTPVSRAAVEADPRAFESRPVCVGPYRFARWGAGEPVRLERSDTYFGSHPAFTRGGAGYADVIRFAPDARAPDLDTTGRGPGRRVRPPGARVEFAGLPTSVPPFDDPRVRTALSLGIDRARLVARTERAERVPARSFVPGSGVDCPPLSMDRAAARAFLAEADVDLSELRSTFVFNDEFDNAALAVELARQWRAVFGMRVTLEPVSFERLMQRGRSASGLESPFRYGWEALVPGREPFLVPLFDDSSIGLDNLSKLDSAGFADALDEARRTIDDAERDAAYDVVERIACAEMAMIPLTVDRRSFTVRTARIGSAIDQLFDAHAADPIVRELFVRR